MFVQSATRPIFVLLRHVITMLVVVCSLLPNSVVTAQAGMKASRTKEASGARPTSRPRKSVPLPLRAAATSAPSPTSGAFPAATPVRTSDGARDGAVRTTPVVLATPPGGVAVVRVPVPPEIARFRARHVGMPVYFAIRSTGGSRLLNGQEGATQPLPLDRVAVPVSVMVNRRLSAGHLEVAVVEFTADSLLLDVPVVLDIAHVGSVTIQVPDRDLVVAPGDWIVARVRLTNAGNGEEQIALQAIVPAGWRARSDSTLTMRPGAVLDATLRLWVPAGALPGLQYVRVLVRRGTSVLAEGQLRATVPPTATTGAGLGVTLSSIGVSSPIGTTAMGYGVSAFGRITDSTEVTVRASLGSSSDAAASFALARSGFLTMPPMVSLKHPRRSLSGGVLNAMLRDPAGAFLSGLGATGAMRQGAWVLGAFGGRPFGQSVSQPLRTSSGLLAGGSLERVVGRNGLFGVQAMHLDDATMLGRIQSVTVHGSNLAVGRGTLSLSAAHRRLWDPLPSNEGAPPSVALVPRHTVAAAANYSVQSATGSLDVRVLHSPGGGRAFARTGNEFAASASKRVNSLFGLSGSGWLQSDANPAIGDVRTTGWNASTTMTPWSWMSLAIDGRGNVFDLITDDVRYHNSEQLAGLSSDVRVGRFYSRLSASAGLASRRTSIDSFMAIGSTGQRLEGQTLLGVSSSRGTLEFAWSQLAYRGVSITLPQQQTLGLRLDKFRLFSVAGEPILLGLDAQRLGATPGFNAPWTMHGELRLPVTRLLGVTLAVDRNPFVLTGYGERTTRELTYSVRFDQQLHIAARVPNRGRRRVVYVDDNANGSFDRGEEPVAGVSVQCGSAITSTDEMGSFRCLGDGDLRLDARTLPLGVLPPAHERLPAGDVALSRVRPVTIQLGVAPADGGRLSTSELEKATVLARDASGTRWVARSAGAGAFVFDALPLGRYLIEFDQAAMREPVTLVGSAPQIWVRRDDALPPIDLTIKPRPARIKTFGPSNTSTATASPAPSRDAGGASRRHDS